jgi:capsule assembly protein Wzi
MRVRRLCVCLSICAGFVGAGAHARGVSPYLPLQTSPEIERQIERLLILADKPVVARPIAAATVFDALPKACERDAVLCEQVKRYLAGYMRNVGISYASLAVNAASQDSVALPNRHGMSNDSSYDLALGIFWQPGDYFLASGGVVAYEGDTTPTGSMLSFGAEYLQIDVGYRDHWLSPFTDSAMLLSTETATMPSVTISNYTPLSRWGIRYEVFLAEMSESSNIVTPDGSAFTSGHPELLGVHLSVEPVPGWSLSVNRILQYGGGVRGESLGDVLDAFFNPSDEDNTGTSAEFGNQLASFTSRFILPSPVPMAVYFEYAGEDTSTLNNLRLGNSALSIGVDFPSLWGRFGLTVEASEWQNALYVHHIYQDGLRNDGRVLGHWGGDWRTPNDGVGAFSWMTRLDWQPKFGGVFAATYRSIDNQTYTGQPYERGYDLEVRYSKEWQAFYYGGEIQTGRDVFGESFTRIGGFIRF